mgnify:CR=1 FL=1
MSGHSKWSTIKHKKAKVDAQRGVAFQKYSRELIVSARLGGPDPAGNFRLRTAIEKAKAAGLPNDNIKRAIDKGAGAAGAENYEELIYEGYAAGGVAVMIEVMTDNRNRTAGDIRSYFSKFNGNLGENGCVGWMFKSVGQITYSADGIDFDKIFEDAISLDAQDIEQEEDEIIVTTKPEDLEAILNGLKDLGYTEKTAETTKIPDNTIEITDKSKAQSILKLIDKLEEHDDVQNVYANFDIPDEILKELE